MLRIDHDNRLTGESVILHVIDTNYKNRQYIMTHNGSMVKSIKELNNEFTFGCFFSHDVFEDITHWTLCCNEFNDYHS